MRALTPEAVRIIRKEYVSRRESYKNPNIIELANRFNVSQETIRKVAKRHLYKNVTDA